MKYNGFYFQLFRGTMKKVLIERSRRSGRNQPVSSRAPVWGASLRNTAASTMRVSFKSCPRVGGICKFAQKACC